MSASVFPNMSSSVDFPVVQAEIQQELPAKSLQPKPTIVARWVESFDELEALIPQWDQLSSHSIRRNPSFEHNYLIPALKYLNDVGARVLVVEGIFVKPNDKTTQNLLGLVPIYAKHFRRIPIKCANVWKHDQCFDATPLIDRSFPGQTFDCMLDFLVDQRFGLFNLDTVSAEPEFKTVFEQVLRQRKLERFDRESWQRAAICPGDDAEAYISKYVSKSVKKTLGRLSRRLADSGKITFELSDSSSDYRELTQQFLQMESAGWKGKAGTALKCNANTESFFKELVERSVQLDRARFFSLNLDGVPIAFDFDILSGGHVCAYKTAYDEQYQEFSPGQQLELNHIKSLHSQAVSLVDSCTTPDNEKLNRMWGQRIEMESFVVALKPGLPTLAVRSMPTLKSILSSVKQLLPFNKK